MITEDPLKVATNALKKEKWTTIPFEFVEDHGVLRWRSTTASSLELFEKDAFLSLFVGENQEHAFLL